jgi:hypothetical protein
MSKKLKVRVMVDGCLVKMQVLEQPEKLRSRGRLKTLASSGCFKLASWGHPELWLDLVFVRGDNRASDNIIVMRIFDLADEAKEYANAIRELVAIANGKKMPKPFSNRKWVVCE